MGLLDRIKSALGLDTSEQGEPSSQPASTGQDVAVTVEHEPDTDSEDAVKGTDTGSETADDTSTGSEPEPAEAGAEAEETEETADTTPASDESNTAEADDAGEDVGSEQSESDDGAQAADVQSIKGIGPAYAQRLAEADVETVADLAEADPAAVAEETGIAEGRVSTWIDRAGE